MLVLLSAWASVNAADGDLAPWESPDGMLNAADVLIATQLVLDLRTPGPLQYAHGDMNIDGVIDLSDLLLIQQGVVTGVWPGDNSMPVAVGDEYTATEDMELIVGTFSGVLANDIDGDSDLLQTILESDALNGTLTLYVDGSFDYTPDPDFAGSDSFTYRANDGSAYSNVAMVTLTVDPVNDAPVALDEAYTTAEDTLLTVAALSGVLANDSDGDSGSLQAVLESNVANGALSLNTDGSFDYTPDPDFAGTDSFTYRANDGAANSDVATVTLTVDPVNDAPVASDEAYTATEDTVLTVVALSGVLANDTDEDSGPLQAVLESDVANGSLSLNTDGSFDYAPGPDFYGTDSFTYRASDGLADSNVATVMLTVDPVNDAPVASDEAYTTTKDTLLAVDALSGVLANDTDGDSGSLQAMLESDVLDGTLTLNIDGSFDYTPDPDFAGTDSFTYRANDGAANSNVATVTITVDDLNDPLSITTGRIAFTRRVIDNTVDETHFTAGADLDGDSDIDLIGTNFVGDAVYWYRNDGSGSFTRMVVDDSLDGAYPAHLGDVDGDGDIDVLAGGYEGDTLAWYSNDGTGSFVKQVVDAAADGIHSVVTVDLDEDGDIDLLASKQDAGTISWYENDGTNAFTLHLIDGAATGAKRAEFADLDGDGDVDVVAASFFATEVAWYENDGSEGFTKHVIDSSVQGAYFVTPANLDGDAFVDLLAASQNDSTIAWYRNSGAGTFARQVIDGGALGARSVFAADVDGDGDIDALAASVDNDTIAWYENNGNGGFTQRVVDQALDGAYGVSAIDMDADADMDVLSASRDDDSISVHSQIREHHGVVPVGGTLVIDSAALLTIDSDDGPSALTYTITGVPIFGELQLDGATLLEGSVFTQADVDMSRLAYVHAGANSPADVFTFTVADGGENGVQPAGGTFVVSSIDPADFLMQLPLDEGSGTLALDASGMGNHGTLVNGPTYEADTPDGSAYAVRLDGIDDYIDLGMLDLAGNGLTLAAWFNPDTFPGGARDPRLISKATGTGANDHVFMLSTIGSGAATRLRGRVRIGGNTTTLIAASGDLATGVWQHGALTHDGMTLRLYLDGVEVGSAPLAGVVDKDPSVKVTVGSQPPGAGANRFDGLIDDVRLLQRALIEEEIAAIVAGE